MQRCSWCILQPKPIGHTVCGFQSEEWIIFILMKTKYPVDTKMLGVVTRDDDVIPSFIFLHGLKLNTYAYIQCLREIVLAWIERVTARSTYIWHQNSTPRLNKQENLILVAKKMSAATSPWPSNCPLVNPLHYYASRLFEWETKKIPQTFSPDLLEKYFCHSEYFFVGNLWVKCQVNMVVWLVGWVFMAYQPL